MFLALSDFVVADVAVSPELSGYFGEFNVIIIDLMMAEGAKNKSQVEKGQMETKISIWRKGTV